MTVNVAVGGLPQATPRRRCGRPLAHWEPSHSEPCGGQELGAAWSPTNLRVDQERGLGVRSLGLDPAVSQVLQLCDLRPWSSPASWCLLRQLGGPDKPLTRRSLSHTGGHPQSGDACPPRWKPHPEIRRPVLPMPVLAVTEGTAGHLRQPRQPPCAPPDLPSLHPPLSCSGRTRQRSRWRVSGCPQQ